MSRPEKKEIFRKKLEKLKEKGKQTELIVAAASPLHSHFPPGCKPGYYLFTKVKIKKYIFLAATQEKIDFASADPQQAIQRWQYFPLPGFYSSNNDHNDRGGVLCH